MKDKSHKCLFFNSSIYDNLYPHALEPTSNDNIGSGGIPALGATYSFNSILVDTLNPAQNTNIWYPVFFDTPGQYSSSGFVPVNQTSSPVYGGGEKEVISPICEELTLNTQPQKFLGIESFITISSLTSSSFKNLNVVGYPDGNSVPTQSSATACVDWYLADNLSLSGNPLLGIGFWARKIPNVSYSFKDIKPGTEIYFDVSMKDNKSGLVVPANTVFKKIDRHKIMMMPYKSDGTQGISNILGAETGHISLSPPAGQPLEDVSLYDNLILDIRNVNDIGTTDGIYNSTIENDGYITDYEAIENYWESLVVYNYTLEKDYVKKGNDYFDIHIPEADVFSFIDVDDMDNGAPRHTKYLREYLPEELQQKYRALYKNLSTLGTVVSDLQYENLKRICAYLSTAPMFTGVSTYFKGYYGTGSSSFNWISYLNSFLSFDFTTGGSFNKDEFKTRFSTLTSYMYQELLGSSGNRYNDLKKHKFSSNNRGEKSYGICNYIYRAIAKKNEMYIKYNPLGSGGIEIDKNLYTSYINGPHIKTNISFTPYIRADVAEQARQGKASTLTYNQHIQAGPLIFYTKMTGNAASNGYPAAYFKDSFSGYVLDTAMNGYETQSSLIEGVNNLFAIHPSVTSIAFYKQGAFKIYESNCYIKEGNDQSAVSNNKLDTKPIFLDREEIGWPVDSYGNMQFEIDGNPGRDKKVVIGFDCGPGAYIKLYRVKAEWLRYNAEELCNCPSFYEEILNYTKKYTGSTIVGVGRDGPQDGTTVGGGAPNVGGGAGSGLTSNPFNPTLNQDVPRGIGFGRVGYCSFNVIGAEIDIIDGNVIETVKTVDIPGVTNTYSPPIKAYGGYSEDIVSALGILLPSHPKPGTALPILNKRNEQYDKNTKCYMRAGVNTDDKLDIGNYSQAGIFTAKKGTFHPFMGWIPISLINSSSNFSRLKNKTFVSSKKLKLKGIGFLFENNPKYDKKYYSSRIALNFSGNVDDDEYYQYGTGVNSYNYLMTNLNKDLRADWCIPDRNCSAVTYTERFAERNCVTLNEQSTGYVDTLASEADKYNPAVTYDMPSNSLVKKRLNNDDTINDTSIKIQDISVRINFLNYVNPKDLKITLYVNLTNQFASTTDTGFINSDSNSVSVIDNHIGRVETQNSAGSLDKIVLFNREYIQNYEKDFCVTFSDNAPIHNVFSVSDELTDTVGAESWKLNPIRSHDSIRPTISTDGDSDTDTYMHKNILLNTKFELSSNKFAKWRGSNLNGAYFKLVIETFNTYETANYSSYITPDYLNEENDGKFKSSVFSNNICNFEIIIDTHEDIDNINHPIAEDIDYKDSLIDYIGFDSPPKEGLPTLKNGYNYIITFNEATKHLLPPINSHSPFNAITNHNTCKFPNNGFNTFAFLRVPPLSSALIALGAVYRFFAAGLTSIAFSRSIRSAAFVASIGLGAIAAGANMILNAFSNQRRERAVDAYDESFYIEEYTKNDGFGESDTVLIDVSKDGAAWYTFDAKIFKFDELSSPIYKPKILSYKKERLNYLTEDKDSIWEKINTGNNYSIFKGKIVKGKDNQIHTYTASNSASQYAPSIVWNNDSKLSDILKEPYAIDLSQNKLLQIHNKFNEYDTTESEEEPLTIFYIKTQDPLAFEMIRSSRTNQLILFGKPVDATDYDLISRKVVNISSMYASPDPETGLMSTVIGFTLTETLGNGDRDMKDLEDYQDINFAIYSDTNSAIILYPWYYLESGIKPADYLDEYDSYKNLKRFEELGEKRVFTLNGHEAAYGEGSWGTGTAYNYEYGKYIVVPSDGRIEDASDKTRDPDNGGLVFGNKGTFVAVSDGTLTRFYNQNNKFQSLNYTTYNKGLPNKDSKNKNQYVDFGTLQQEGGEGEEPTPIPEYGEYLCHTVKVRDNDIEKTEKVINPNRLTSEEKDNIYTKYDDNKYWINIDKNQKGRFSRTNSVKVLKRIEYSCYEVNNDEGLNCINVCGDSPNDFEDGARDTDNGGPPVVGDPTTTESLKQKSQNALYNQVATYNDYGDPTMVFTNTDQAIAAQKALYPNANWNELIIEKPNLRLSCDETNIDTILRIREYYDVAGENKLVEAGDLMENSDDIKIKFVHWPRKLKELDLQFDKYVLDSNGNVASTGRNRRTDGMNIKNSFFSWVCGYTNQDRSAPIQPVVPPYYKLVNEMIFRAFYGSKDRLEFKEPGLVTRDDFEWIPYEYDSKNACRAVAIRQESDITLYTRALFNPSKAGYYLRCSLYTKFLSLGLPGLLKDTQKNQNQIRYKCRQFVSQTPASSLKTADPTIFPDRSQVNALENEAKEYMQIYNSRGSVPSSHYTSGAYRTIRNIINAFS